MNSVNVEDKKKFLKWVVKNVTFKNREAVWILNYLSGSDDLLKNIVFTDININMERGLLLSSTSSKKVPLRLYKKGLVSDDGEKAFHEMRMNKGDTLYVQIDFEDKFQSIEYVAVHEEVHNSRQGVSYDDMKAAKTIIETSQRQMMLKEIDRALDSKDHKMFMELWEAYQGIGKENISVVSE